MERATLERLRTAARIAAVGGAIGSVVLTLVAGKSTPRLLLALFVVWVLAPFLALAWGIKVSPRWSVPTQVTLMCAALVITLLSLAVYGGVVGRPAGTANAFMFVVVPPASWVLLAIAVAFTAVTVRRRARRRKERR